MRRSAIQGRGVYARVDIACGTRLIEYTGERISHAEADRRDDAERKKRHHTFLFILNSRTVIDARYGGNISKYINHSCEPNCEARFEGTHIWIYAIRDIMAGEELGYDYEYDWVPEYTAQDLAEYACRCGSGRCRGTLVDLPPDKMHLTRALTAPFQAGA
jgi:SET domain-containing protein